MNTFDYATKLKKLERELFTKTGGEPIDIVTEKELRDPEFWRMKYLETREDNEKLRKSIENLEREHLRVLELYRIQKSRGFSRETEHYREKVTRIKELIDEIKEELEHGEETDRP